MIKLGKWLDEQPLTCRYVRPLYTQMLLFYADILQYVVIAKEEKDVDGFHRECLLSRQLYWRAGDGDIMAYELVVSM